MAPTHLLLIIDVLLANISISIDPNKSIEQCGMADISEEHKEYSTSPLIAKWKK